EATQEQNAAKSRLEAAQEMVSGLTREVAAATTREAETASGIPPLRDAEAREAASLQRLLLARDGLEQEERRIEAERRDIEARITQIDGDRERESARRTDA